MLKISVIISSILFHTTCYALDSQISLIKIEALSKESSRIKRRISLLERELFSENQTFLDYRREYLYSLRNRPYKFSSREKIFSKITNAKLVLVGDEHLSNGTQENTVSILEEMSKGTGSTTIVLEWIDGRYQSDVNRYLDGSLPLYKLKEKIKFDQSWGFSWKDYLQILTCAKRLGIRILLVNDILGVSKKKKSMTLTEKDDAVVETVLRDSKVNSNMRYVVAFGVFHLLGKNHMRDKFMKAGINPDVTVISHAERFFWSALKRSKNLSFTKYLNLGNSTYFMYSGNPIEQNKRTEKMLQDWLDQEGMIAEDHENYLEYQTNEDFNASEDCIKYLGN